MENQPTTSYTSTFSNNNIPSRFNRSPNLIHNTNSHNPSSVSIAARNVAKTRHIPDKNGIKVLYFNSISLKNKYHLLDAYISSNTPMEYDLIFITETWLKPKFTDSLITPIGYSAIRRDRPGETTGGGVLVFYKDSLKVVDITPTFEDNTYDESVVIEVIPDSRISSKLRFCCTYLSPSNSRTIPGVQSCCRLIRKINFNGPLFVLGDFNLPTVDWPTMCSANTAEQYFTDFCCQVGLTQHIREPTYHGQRDSLLDLVLTNCHATDILLSSYVVQPIAKTCDHDAIVMKVNCQANQSSPISKPILCFQKANYELISSSLQSTDWNSLLKIGRQDLQQSYDNFLGKLHSVIEEHVPKTVYRKGFNMPRYLKKLARKKASLYKRKKTNTLLKAEYIKASKVYDLEVKKWFRKIEEKICSSRDRSNFYKYANRKLKIHTTIPAVINVKDQQISDDLEKANHFNEQFTAVFQRDNLSRLNLVDKTSVHLDNIDISSDDILSAINKIKPKSSKTPDDIPPIFLKKVGPFIITPLMLLFQASLTSGYIPNEWRTALVNPVHKKGSKNDALNFRPISLTSSICRLLESVIKTKILKHLYDNNLISAKQHGFLPGRSISSQLLTYLNPVINDFDKKIDTHLIYTDFSKAFDKVCHEKLLEVLSSFGIKGSLLQWIRNFLTDRSQAVYIGDKISIPTKVVSGVPQGSVLGPLLFLLYVQDIDSVCSENCDVALFADDCKFISSDPHALQSSLDKMLKFVKDRQLVLCKEKCNHLAVTRRQNSCHFYLEGNEIPTSESVRDLGITLTSKLHWKPHIQIITQKAYHAAHKILFSFSSNKINTLIFAFKTFVRPILESNCVVWSPHLKGDINRIESVQRFFTKKLFQRCGISSSGYHDRLSKLNLKTLEHRRLVADLVMVFKMLNNYIDVDPNVLFNLKPNNYNLRGHSQTLIRTRATSNTLLNSFPSRIVRIWNNLPEYVVCSSSIGFFKYHVNSLNLVAI